MIQNRRSENRKPTVKIGNNTIAPNIIEKQWAEFLIDRIDQNKEWKNAVEVFLEANLVDFDCDNWKLIYDIVVLYSYDLNDCIVDYLLKGDSVVQSFLIKILLRSIKFNPAMYDNRLIRLASEWGMLEIVDILLKDPRVDPTANNNQAIRNASKNKHTNVVKLLLADGRVNSSVLNNSHTDSQ